MPFQPIVAPIASSITKPVGFTKFDLIYPLIKAPKVPTTSRRASPKPQPIASTSHTKSTEPEYDEYDDEFGSEPPQGDDSDSWFQPAVNEPPAFVSFVRPSVGPAGAMKLIQPSAAALKAAEKLLASVEDEDDKDTTVPASTTTKLPQPFVPPKPSTVSVSKEDPKSKAIPKTLLVTHVEEIQPRVAATPARPSPSQPKINPSNASASAGTKHILHETPARNPVLADVSESPIMVPKHLGMRSRPRGSLKAKFATPWKQGVNIFTQPSPAPQVHTPRAAPPTPTPCTSKATKPAVAKRIIRDANTVFDLSR